MAEAQEYTYSEIKSHNTKKDLFMVIHDVVYNASSFVDEHPGGEEVLLDVGGQDATEAFEDVGHSDEAREILEGMIAGKLKRQPGDPTPKVAPPSTSSVSSSDNATTFGIGLYAVILIGGAAAYAAYNYMQNAQKKV